MILTPDVLGKTVELKYADGSVLATGVCLSYCEAPTLMIQLPNGEHIHWRADLSREVT